MKSIVTLCALFASVSLTFAADGEKPKKPAGEGDKPRPSAEERFKKLDADADGSVSKAEFEASPMAKKDPAKAAQIFGEKDKDKNGSLSKDEFAAHGPGKKPEGGKPEGAPKTDGSKPEQKQQ